MMKREGRLDFLTSYVDLSRRSSFSLQRIVCWIKMRRNTFSTAVWLSVIFHLLLLGYISLSQASSPDSRRGKPGNDFAVLNQALMEMQEEILNSGGIEGLLPEYLEEDVDELMRGLYLGRTLSDRDKLELYKKLIESLLALKQENALFDPEAEITLSDILSFLEKEGGWELSSGKKIYPSSPGQDRGDSQFHSLTKERRETLNFLRRYEDQERERTQYGRGMVAVETDTGIKYIPHEYYYRESPYEEILAHGTSLFCVIRGFPVLTVEEEKGTEKQEDEERGPQYNEGFSVVFLTGFSPLTSGFPEPDKSQRSSLEFPGEKKQQLKQILDGLMAFPEEDQFEIFSEKFLDVYDPESKDLAELTHEFIYNNLCNVIIVIDPVSSAFDFIEELYFNKRLDFLFLEYWRKFPKTSTGFEFLFSLASHYDFERRALEYLLGAYRDAKKILNRQYYQANVFNIQAKAYIIREIYEDLFFRLKEKGYDGFEHVIKKYRDEQIGIYERIIGMGGELRDRALFALGRVYWDEGNVDLALQKWDSIGPGYDSKSFQSVQKARNGSQDRDEMIQRIDDLFEWEALDESGRLLERLLKYDKWKKREKADKAKAVP